MSRPFDALLLFASLFAGVAVAQNPSAQAGIAPAWDMRDTIRNLLDQTNRYKSIVEQIKPSDWVPKGAPDAYVRQRDVAQRELDYLQQVALRLSENPERLPLALDAFFRLEFLETYTVALSDGAKRYQSEQLGNDLATLVAQNSAVRTKLRQYVMDLSVTKETEYTVAEKEAQRCQSVLNRNPLAPEPKAAPITPAVRK